MAAITPEGRADLVALYLTMFGRAPTTLELSRMVTAWEKGNSLASIAAAAAVDPALEADFALVNSMDAQSFANYLANALLASDIPAAARTWAINWVVTNVQGAKSKTQVIAEAVAAIRATTNPNYASSKAELTADVTVALTNIDNPPPVNKTTSLTISATDVVNGGSGMDEVIGQLGQSITLQASDEINGGAGADTLRIVSDGAAAQTAGGFTVTNVETLEVQSQAVGGTTLSLENVTGLTSIVSSSSSTDITLNQVKSITPLTIGSNVVANAITVNYQAAAATGTADVQKVTVTGSATGALTFTGGIEALEINSITGALGTTIASVAATPSFGSTFNKVTVTGDKALTITGALAATVTTLDASAKTAGGLTATVGAADIAVKGGAGNDSITFTGTLTSADSYDGGAGTDTVIANVADFTGSSYAVASKITNVEVIRFADALVADFDASKFTGENTYTLASFTGPVTISKADDASTLNVRGASTGTLTYSIGDGATLATATGTANTLTVNLGVSGTNGISAGTIAAAGVETLNLNSNGLATTAGGNTVTIIDAEATSLKVSGAEDLTLTLAGTALTTLDASASTGANDFTGVSFKAATAATITGGAGADKITGSAAGDTINGGAGADTITGAGGADSLTGGAGIDTFNYTAASDSSGASQDTITDFTSGTDLIGVLAVATAVGRPAVVLKNGAAADFGAAQSSIALNSGTTQVVFQADTKTLWVDLNDDGTLNNNDLAIKLPTVSSIAAADLVGTGSGNSITLSATTTAVTTTTSTGATGTTTVFSDTITSVAANVVAATASVDGSTGTDTLVVTDALTAALDDGLINIENLTLANAANTVIDVVDANSFRNITGGTGVDTLTSTADIIEGGTISLGDGNDVVSSLVPFETTAGADTSVAFTIDMGAGDDAVTTGATMTALTSSSTLAGGAGTDTLTIDNAGLDIKAGNVTGFENLVNGTGTLTLTNAQYAQFTGTITNGGTITLNDSGSLTVKSGGTINAGAAVDTITVASGAATVNALGGNDTISGTSVAILATTAIDGGAGTDTVSINLNGAASTHNGGTDAISNIESLVFTNSGAAAVLTLVATNAYSGTTYTIDASALTTGVVFTGTGLTNATSIKLGSGNDTITNLNAGAQALTFDFGAGNASVTDFTDSGATHSANTNNVTLKFGTSAGTQAISFAATTEDLLAGDVLDFASNVTSVVSGAANGTLGIAGGTGQVFIDNTGTDTVITFDADGNRTFSAGDVQITLVGHADISAGIDTNGNLVIS